MGDQQTMTTEEYVIETVFALSCDQQHALAEKIAANVGYRLVPEATIQDAEDETDVSARLDRLEAAVLELNPGLNWHSR